MPSAMLDRVRETLADRAPEHLALVGDIGGTNARYGLVDLSADKPEILDAHGYLTSDYPRSYDSVTAYLERVGLKRPPHLAVIAVAGPIVDGAIRFTNLDWELSESALVGMGFDGARLLNDYAALALAAPLLEAGDTHQIGGPSFVSSQKSIAVLGPGTGFGVSALARDGTGHAAMATEGGHVAFAPVDEVEIEILRILTRKFGRVSIERILSGPGMCDLHDALCEIDGKGAVHRDPAEITRRAVEGDASALRTVNRFCAILGSVAGDLALTLGAQGGVYIGGGIAPRILDILDASPFRERFEDKGRFRGYVEAIPVKVILRPYAALLGAAHAPRLLALG